MDGVASKAALLVTSRAPHKRSERVPQKGFRRRTQAASVPRIDLLVTDPNTSPPATDTPAAVPTAAAPPAVAASAAPVAGVPEAAARSQFSAAPNWPPSWLDGRWVASGAVILALLAAGAMGFAWNAQQRVKALESELVKRQQATDAQATEARTLARQAEAVAREAGARVALLDARVAETSMQRSQFEELVQSLSRSRDENVLADIDSALRVALQQSAITGSAEPLVLTLRQADERLARYNQPRLERVRRAVLQDLDRTRAAGVSDISVLSIRLDEVIRLVNDLPLLAQPERRGAAVAPVAAASPATAASSAGTTSALRHLMGDAGEFLISQVWREIKSLVRVTRIDDPEAMLLAPEQGYFLRENLKLRLLNARLALMSRQFDTAQLDLREAQVTLDRFFDRSTRRVQQANDLLKQVTVQARAVALPRPDATLAAIATAAAGR